MQLITNQFVRVVARATDSGFAIETFERNSSHKYGNGLREALRWCNDLEAKKLKSFASRWVVA